MPSFHRSCSNPNPNPHPNPNPNPHQVGAYQALLYVMYPMLLISVISIFDCRPVDAYTGLEVLDAQPSIDCYSEVRLRLRLRVRVTLTLTRSTATARSGLGLGLGLGLP